eukprot:TRINITY_DN81022_c0_g1_i1.p1 TRINITY_DN81022_c0_g1~~TRINITY_DN81022_c0_g1_i1.p1  ORF type:complete len:328 (-),score=102.36 TRINITY_DN81022_c0_g1_i1:151-1134(-)
MGRTLRPSIDHHSKEQEESRKDVPWEPESFAYTTDDLLNSYLWDVAEKEPEAPQHPDLFLDLMADSTTSDQLGVDLPLFVEQEKEKEKTAEEGAGVTDSDDVFGLMPFSPALESPSIVPEHDNGQDKGKEPAEPETEESCCRSLIKVSYPPIQFTPSGSLPVPSSPKSFMPSPRIQPMSSPTYPAMDHMDEIEALVPMQKKLKQSSAASEYQRYVYPATPQQLVGSKRPRDDLRVYPAPPQSGQATWMVPPMSSLTYDERRHYEEMEMKRRKRLQKNKEAAQASRRRKKVYMEELERDAKQLRDENAKLREEVRVLKETLERHFPSA